MLPLLDIIVVNHRTPELTAELARRLVAWGRARVVVVDTGSGEGFPPVEGAALLALAENRGFGHAANAGARAGGGEWLLFLNPDVTIEPAALDALLARMTSPAVLGGPVSAGPRSHGPQLADGSAEWIAGSLLAVPRADFEGVGGFDESYFMYFEDVDLCERLRARGLPCVVVPGARHEHRGGASYEAAGQDRGADYRRSRALYLRRKYGTVAALCYRVYVAARAAAGGSVWRRNERC